MDMEQTQIIVLGRNTQLPSGNRLHCLELANGDDSVERFVVGPFGLRIGRVPPADIVLAESGISRSHCLVALRDDALLVTDLNSTNGTYVDGVRITGATSLPIGSVVQVGAHTFKHEWRTRAEIELAAELDRELQNANSYVQALLPPPSREGPVKTEWIHLPCARLGGDAFGYGRLAAEDLFVGYLIDVAGHGAGAAMHAVAVMNQLRQRSLPDTDFSKPAEVLLTLNRLYQMDEHADLYFTIWYGVYNARTRQLDYACAGHHPAFLVPADRSDAIPVGNRNVMIGAIPGMGYKQASIEVPPGAMLYLFSDGVFEIVDRAGRQWALEDFRQLILQPDAAETGEAQRLYQSVRGQTRPGPFDDDFSLVVMSFE